MLEREELITINNEVSFAARTGRSIETYRKYFGVRPEYLKGMKILDLGAGDSDFAEIANIFGANVVRVDPKYSDHLPFGNAPAVAAIGQALPFPDGTFDLTVASFSLYWVKTGIDRTIAEMVRVTKDNCQAKIFPTLIEGNNKSIKKISKAISMEAAENETAQTLSVKKNPAYSLDKWNSIARNLLDVCDFHAYHSPDSQHNLTLLQPFQPETLTI
jgi:ubiquinone/menaquinone biosynthesis C-methylase UbiE